MRTNKKLAIEKLERREVFSVAPGFEGLTPETNVTDQEIIDALNAGTQVTTDHRVDSSRDAASGLPSGKRSLSDLGDKMQIELIDASLASFNIGMPPSATQDGQRAANVDRVFAEPQSFDNQVAGVHW